MRRSIATFVGLGLSCCWAISAGAQAAQNNSAATPTAQTNAATSAPGDAAGSPLKGARFVGKLTTKLDSKHAKVGQAVVVEVKKDVKSGDQVVLKKGALVNGTVTQVTPYSKGSAAELDISFDNVGVKGGEQSPAHFAIYALWAKLEKQPDDMYLSGGKKQLATSAAISGQVEAPRDNELRPETTGIFGFTDLELHPLVKMTPPTSTVNCKSGNIVLENGTEMVLTFVGQ
jgi:hypothetical protein